MKVLIVEDNDDDRRLLKINMQHQGCEVIEASNGQEALELALSEKPELIIADILMPKMDGFELLWSLKQDEQTKNIPFIFYSAIYTGEKDKKLAMALGAEAFIEKPKEPEEFYRRVCEIVERCRLKGSSRLPDMELIMKEQDFLKAYSQIVASKLDEKVRELSELSKKYSKLCTEFKTLLDSMPDNIYLLDSDLKIVWCNRRVETSFDKSTDEIIGKHCYAFFHGRDIPCSICPVQKAFVSGNIESMEKKTKDERLWEIRAVPIKDERGKVVNTIEIARDITEERKTQEQLIHAQRMEAIGILAGGIAHDFKNMLTPIIGFAQLIKIFVDKSSPIYNYAENIISAGEKASSLVQGLLAFSRKQVLDMESVVIDDLIFDFSEIISRIIGEDIELKLNLNSGKHVVMADITQIQQVLMNLITNARDAMPKGGVLTISTELIDIDENFIKIHGFGELGRYILITVSDTGIGMDETTKSKIFEPFFTTKPVGKGTGLGLSIVYGIVKQHNGYINVYSELGKGTTFKIYLPVVEEREEVVKKEILLDFEYLKGEGETILLVEDDDTVRDYIRTVLEEANYRVIEAKMDKRELMNL
ncbi:MAG: response regulator [Thermodesulfovibrio sp.]|nr:response regulator [Thermodesulfovibrio sp.]